MNQKKTGKFISKLRKEKKLTQENLAEKLGVSINAVSKWERGLSFPDVSLFKELCSLLDISIEELINGEKDNSEEAKEKAIISTIKENSKLEKKFNKKLLLFIILFITILLTTFIYLKKDNINLVSDSDYLYDYAINYLKEEEYKTNNDSSKNDFNTFYSYHGFGIEKNRNYKYVYMWIYRQSYYLEEEKSLAISGGVSMPFKITFENDKVIKVETPMDGEKYISSIKEMFPTIISDQVLNFDNENNINKLYVEVAEKKNKYYEYLNIDKSNITIDDISNNNLIFSIWIGKRDYCIPVQLNVYKDNTYKLYTAYKTCRENVPCNSILNYTKYTEGKYNFDVMEIIRHSIDANNMSFTNLSLPKYEITTGNGYPFITDDDNKYLNIFLKSINVNLSKCAEKDYVND